MSYDLINFTYLRKVKICRMENGVNIVKEIFVNDLESFIKMISYKGALRQIFSSSYIYRGESSAKYTLLPTALRENKNDELWSLTRSQKPIDNQHEWEYWQTLAEYSILRNFFKTCDDNNLYIPQIDNLRNNIIVFFDLEFSSYKSKWLPKELYELAGLAQHYGLPTRFLDWSMDIYTSLYFASIGSIKNYDSTDYMVLWALNAQFIEFIKHTKEQLPLKIIKPQYCGNPNLGAQKGIFTFWEIEKPIIDISFLNKDIQLVDRTPLDQKLIKTCPQKQDYENLLYKIYIPHSLSSDLYEYLNEIGYNASKLFPGYYGVVQHIKENAIIASHL